MDMMTGLMRTLDETHGPVPHVEVIDEYYREGGSEKHLRDIAGVLKVSGDRVDREYISRWARQLNLDDIWQAILART